MVSRRGGKRRGEFALGEGQRRPNNKPYNVAKGLKVAQARQTLKDFEKWMRQYKKLRANRMQGSIKIFAKDVARFPTGLAHDLEVSEKELMLGAIHFLRMSGNKSDFKLATNFRKKYAKDLLEILD